MRNSNMIEESLIINGRELFFEKEQTILGVAESNDIHIPTL